MSLSLSIDARRRVVVTRAVGVVTEADIASLRDRLRAHRAFDNRYAHLLDLRDATDLPISAVSAVRIVSTSVFAPGGAHAIVGGTDSQLDVARMLAAIAHFYRHEVRVFGDAADAERWLSDPGLAAIARSAGSPRLGDPLPTGELPGADVGPHPHSGETPTAGCAPAGPPSVGRIRRPTCHNPLLVNTRDGARFACWVERVKYVAHWAFINSDLRRLLGPPYRHEDTVAAIQAMVNDWWDQRLADEPRER